MHDDLQNEKKRRLGCHGQQIIERRTDTDKIMVEKRGGRKETCQSEFKTKTTGKLRRRNKLKFNTLINYLKNRFREYYFLFLYHNKETKDILCLRMCVWKRVLLDDVDCNFQIKKKDGE